MIEPTARILLLCLFLAAAAPLAVAQPQPAPPASEDASEPPPEDEASGDDAEVATRSDDPMPLLEDLASSDYRAREAATRRLLAMDQINHAMLRRMYDRIDIAEQRNRMFTVAQHHLLRAMQQEVGKSDGGVIGIRIEGVNAREIKDSDRAAVRVVYTMPGFPSYAHLEVGDLITHINGEPLVHSGDGAEAMAALQHTVMENHHAGQKISTTVLRSGKTRTFRFKLGSRTAMSTLYVNHATLRPKLKPSVERYITSMHESLAGADEATAKLDVKLPARSEKDGPSR